MQPNYPAGYDRPVASLARHVLSVIEARFAEANVELPTRKLTTVGSVSVDEEVLAIMFGGVYVGPPGNELNTPITNRSGGLVPRSAVFNIELWRFIPALTPGGMAPSPEVETAAAEDVTQDAWLLLEAAFDADQMGIGVIARVDVHEPRGEYHGLAMTLELTIP